jgi:hypothetical protein
MEAWRRGSGEAKRFGDLRIWGYGDLRIWLLDAFKRNVREAKILIRFIILYSLAIKTLL